MIAIVGGGIAGLTTAIALRKAGFEVTVFDRVRDVTAVQIGAGLGLAPNATRVLRASACSRACVRSEPRGALRVPRRERRLLSTWEIPKESWQFEVDPQGPARVAR